MWHLPAFPWLCGCCANPARSGAFIWSLIKSHFTNQPIKLKEVRRSSLLERRFSHAGNDIPLREASLGSESSVPALPLSGSRLDLAILQLRRDTPTRVRIPLPGAHPSTQIRGRFGKRGFILLYYCCCFPPPTQGANGCAGGSRVIPTCGKRHLRDEGTAQPHPTRGYPHPI